MVITKELEEILEPIFLENSFGYRPNKSAHQAITQARKNCWNNAWVLDMDIKGFFDNIDYGLMIRALRNYTDKEYVITYVKRWLKAPIQLKDGTLIQNLEKGTPQGGVISPLLANLFLHVVFGKWMEGNFPDIPFERYADDIIVHAKNERIAKSLLKSIGQRMTQCKLELHPEKTKLVYCNRKGRHKRNKAKTENLIFWDLLSVVEK
jgi:RNA-directed DNA polymerase